MVSYLQTYTLGLLIRSAFAIFFRNWVALFAIYAVPLIPVYVLKVIVAPPGMSLTDVVFRILVFLVSMFATYPATVAVSEYCLGIKPSFARSYARVFTAPGRLLMTVLLSSFILFVGFIALFVPGLVLSVWYVFVGPVVVLEGLGGMAALRRSRELGRGYYARNLGIAFVTQLIVFVFIFVLSVLIAIPMVLLGASENLIAAEFLGAVAAAAVTPVFVVALVLLYYDMRARREGYGAAQLAEDIRF
jgi:hypothetical protein